MAKLTNQLATCAPGVKHFIMRAILVFFTLLSHSLAGQDENRFRNFHGIKQAGNIHFFEAEGYEIFIQPHEFAADERGMSIVKRIYKLREATINTDSVLQLKTLTSMPTYDGVSFWSTYYFIPQAGSNSTIIGFTRPKTRDIDLERQFVRSYLEDKIPSFVYTSIQVDSINFAGRMIKVSPVCRWMKPHNLQCPDFGQMNWAIFDRPKDAEDYLATHFEMNKKKNLVDIKEENWIRVKMEGQETKALRAKIKVQLPKFVMGGSNVLIVYYVAAPVRGKHVACILSHYTDDVGAGKITAAACTSARTHRVKKMKQRDLLSNC